LFIVNKNKLQNIMNALKTVTVVNIDKSLNSNQVHFKIQNSKYL